MKSARELVGFLAALWLCAACAGQGGLKEPRTAARESSAEELYELASRSERLGDSARAEQYAVAALSRGLPEKRGTGLLVRVCLGADRPRSALKYAVPYLVRHPDDVALRFLVASTYAALGQAEEAREELTTLVGATPGFAPGYYLLAVLDRDALAEPEQATEAFEAYLRLAPEGMHAGEARAFLRSKIPATGRRHGPRTSTGASSEPHRRLRADPAHRAGAAEAAARRSGSERDPRQWSG